MTWIVIYEMDDYEPSIHEYETKDLAIEDWKDNKDIRPGRKCVAKIMCIEDGES